MGVEGMVLALGALFAFAYVVPLLTKQRRVLVSTPIDERFCEDLRLIETSAVALDAALGAEQEERGKIYLTERTMMTKKEAAVELRAVARDRSRARARIAQRRALTKRGILLTAVLVAATAGLWIAVAAASTPLAIAIASTLITGAFVLVFGYATREWAAQDDEDRHTIEGANRLLAAHKRTAVKRRAANRKAAGVGKDKLRQIEAAASKAAAEPVAAAVTAPASAEPEVAPAAPKAKPVATAAPADRRVRPAKAAPAPSYTLKPAIQKRIVKPYEEPAQPTAAVPYRPTQVGETVSGETMAAANPAPEMTGAEELRSDVLGGGDTLDELLARRRA